MMASHWLITMKPSFREEWLALPTKEVRQVHEKMKILEQDPTPDAKVKKQLKHIKPRLYRIRCGDYRLFYTFDAPHISLLALRRRDDDTYDEDFDVEFLGGPEPLVQIDVPYKRLAETGGQFLTGRKAEVKNLPEPITEEFLTRFCIPQEYHPCLLHLKTEDDLMDCPGVSGEILEKLLEYMFPRPIEQVMHQPDLLVQEVENLLHFKEGELLGFLLKLSPEQEKYVHWALNATGPTLLKGDPGTGKSTIALYRVRVLVQELRKQGRIDFRILFTTYTNALVNSSEQLLRQLLGEDMAYVEVQTADKIVMKLLGHAGREVKILDGREVSDLLRQAVASVQFDGTPQQKQTLERMSLDYLRQEVNQVIVARQIRTLKQYLETPRQGRKVRLSGLQRRAVWSVYDLFRQLLEQRGKITWRQARALAETVVARGTAHQLYDAVVIDEAQDLDPSALRLLVQLCKQAQRVFITADANQSIYGSGFSWTDVHETLRFQGRTAVLHANYRSTREIGEAAQAYLAYGALDNEPVEQVYMNNGPLPVTRRVANGEEQVQLLLGFFREARKYLRLSLSTCAVLCPTVKAGKAIAADLTTHGIEATFMSGQELDLTRAGIKVLTLRSAKGLEFPIVALAGFLERNWHAAVPSSATGEEREEFLELERRAMFVGMTRAMRALLVVVPAWGSSPLLTGFDARYWNLGE
jgi:superfamily I DNA/RNA helicase/mRNA-degrading endonuclease RelE of RelBE toxin-antitoxin system